MRIRIDYNSGEPICSQVAAQIKLMVVRGSLKPGDKLPSIRELSKTLKINPTTVSRIYNELSYLGIITLRQGQGAFVAKQETRLAPKEVEHLVSQLAQTMLVEGLRLGLDVKQIKKIVDGEYKKIKESNDE